MKCSFADIENEDKDNSYDCVVTLPVSVPVHDGDDGSVGKDLFRIRDPSQTRGRLPEDLVPIREEDEVPA